MENEEIAHDLDCNGVIDRTNISMVQKEKTIGTDACANGCIE